MTDDDFAFLVGVVLFCLVLALLVEVTRSWFAEDKLLRSFGEMPDTPDAYNQDESRAKP